MLQKQNIDWDKLGFNASKTRSMWVGDCINDETWSRGALEPYGNINISPAACVLNYAQGVFEGMKAYHTKKDRIVLFRPHMNANRMAESTEKMCIPKMVPDYFINAVKATTLDNIDFVPPFEKGAMYLRPIVFGTTPSISVGPSIEYKFIVFASPVGSYFPEGAKPLNMLISSDFHRAAPKGIGNAKAIGNYSASLFPGKQAKAGKSLPADQERYPIIGSLDEDPGDHQSSAYFCAAGRPAASQPAQERTEQTLWQPPQPYDRAGIGDQCDHLGYA